MTLHIDPSNGTAEIKAEDGKLEISADSILLQGNADVKLPSNRESSSINLNEIRIASQVHQLALQGITLSNTFKEMNEVWLECHDQDKRCMIVEQQATKVKYQLVTMYVVKLYRYMKSIVGLDLVPLAQQDGENKTWKLDAIVLNIASNQVKDHEDLFRSILINLFGVSEQLLDIAFNPTIDNVRKYIKDTYDVDLGETEGLVNKEFTIDQASHALTSYIADPKAGYKLY